MSESGRNAPQLTARREGQDTLVLALSGDWKTRPGLPGIEAVEREIEAGPPPKTISFTVDDLGEWDTAFLVFLVKCLNFCRDRNIEFHTDPLPLGARQLLHLSEAVPEKKDAARNKETPPLLHRVGESALARFGGAREVLEFVGENVIAFGRMLRGRAQFRWSDSFVVMQETGPEALGIVALINFLIGLILAFVGAVQLTQFGASIYVADLVAIGTVREMGCIMTGIIICGRTGAAFAAQLGTMKVNEELDAFKTFGISPTEFLVLPRMVALILMMPLLVAFADLIAIAGGFAVSISMLDITATEYIDRTIEAIKLKSFLLGIGKGIFFGIVVALTGCLRGMQCGSNAAAVGQATTSAVVAGITWIIASDGIFAVITTALGI